MTNTTPKLFQLRVLAEYHSDYGYFVANCLETGNVVTADDSDTAVEMMLEILRDEVTYALEHEDFSQLLSTPAPAHVWLKWKETARHQEPERRTLDIQLRKDLLLNEQEIADVVVSKAA